MTLEELWEIKDRKSAETKNMTFNELKEYLKKSDERFLDKVGRDNFVPTDNPNVWKHIAKKVNTL